MILTAPMKSGFVYLLDVSYSLSVKLILFDVTFLILLVFFR